MNARVYVALVRAALYMRDSSNTTVITTVISNAQSAVFQDFCFRWMLLRVVRFIGVNVSGEAASLPSTSFTAKRTHQVSPKYTWLWRCWPRHCATKRKVAGSIPVGVIAIFHWHNPSGRTMTLALSEPLTEMSTRNITWGVKAVGA